MVTKIILNDSTNNKITKVDENESIQIEYNPSDYSKLNSLNISLGAITSEGKYINNSTIAYCDPSTDYKKTYEEHIQELRKKEPTDQSGNPIYPGTENTGLGLQLNDLKSFFDNNDYNTRRIFIIPKMHPCDAINYGSQYIHTIELEGESAKDIIKRKDNAIIGIGILLSFIIFIIIIIIFINNKDNIDFRI